MFSTLVDDILLALIMLSLIIVFGVFLITIFL
jgi:hypothetical protein